MAKKERKTTSTILGKMIFHSLMAALMVGLIVFDVLFFGEKFHTTADNHYLIIMYLSVSGLGVILFLLVILIFRRLYLSFYKDFYKTTLENFRLMSHQKNELKPYPISKTKEFKELNDELDRLTVQYTNSIIISASNDYHNIKTLKFEDSERQIVTYDSFVQNIKNIIHTSEQFRNAVISIDYDLEDQTITKENQNHIIESIHNIFNNSNILSAFNLKERSLIFFVPNIDSMTLLNEEVDALLTQISILKASTEGSTMSLARASIVIYPYSNIDDIISDLGYAKRQGKVINLYLPNRLNEIKNDSLYHATSGLNNIAKLIEDLSQLRPHSTNFDNQLQLIKNTLLSFCQYLNIDYAGLATYDEKEDDCRILSAISTCEEEIFNEGKKIDSSFIKLANQLSDKDHSYCFINRKHVNPDFGRILDFYEISSGYVYICETRNKPFGFVYFVNKERDFKLTSYIRESALIVAHLIGRFLLESQQINYIAKLEDRNNSILQLSGFHLYGIDPKTCQLDYLSDSLRDALPKIKLGTRCYKALYNKDRQCDNCPLLTKKKMISQFVDNKTYETSLTLMEKGENSVKILMKPTSHRFRGNDRFDQDMLVNSFYSLFDHINDEYISHGKGYILLFSIDNYLDIMAKFGNEGYYKYMRLFTRSIISKQLNTGNVYMYKNNNTMALLLPETGRIDIIDKCEAIYDISCQNFMDDESTLKLTFMAIKYPQHYASADDFIRNVESYIGEQKKNKGKNLITFEEDNYVRSASKKEFYFSVIEKSFVDKTFKIKLQPMLHGVTKRMLGAELLIRLSDDYRNVVLNTSELIKVAAANGKIGAITDALLEYIGELYKQYGFSIFKAHNFTRLSLNTDYSYFSDPSFIKKTSALMNQYYLPKNFLAFEVTEQEISENFDAFRKIASSVVDNEILLVCDQYTGQYVSIEKLKDMGFSEIKISRSIIKDIDINKTRLSEVLELLSIANQLHIKVTLVGIENKEQYTLIKESGYECYMQGFYFYQPLDTRELIEAIRKTNY